MLTLHPKDIPSQDFYSYLVSSIAPRPIALASTISHDDIVNLSPFSFFNFFGANSPIIVFSPNHRGRDGSIKDTLQNVIDVPEVVINLVDYQIVEQMSLSSCEYPSGTNEFVKAGFTEEKSLLVKPPRVKESPVQYECKVLEIKNYHYTNLVICEIMVAHFSESILNEKQRIAHEKTDWVARMGGNWYVRASGEATFEVEKPNAKKGIGFDNIPSKIRFSKILTGNDLGKLGNIDALPDESEIQAYLNTEKIQNFMAEAANGCVFLDNLLHAEAQKLLKENQVKEAWLVLLQS
jgi:flavin reductase (DIM6/NTAB) family NADH-FMN oxidoreductase RutF